MSLNQILAISESVGINDQRFVGQMLSRNQKISTSEVMTVVPFAFEMNPMPYLRYSENRTLLSTLRANDKALPQYLNFGTTGWENYIKYQGELDAVQIAACTWQPESVNTTMVLGDLPTVAPNTYLLKVGDFVQIGLYSYIVTSDVFRGEAETVTVPVHRNLLSPVTSPIPAVFGQFGETVAMGGNNYVGITFQVILMEYPTYTLIPFKSDSYIQWNGAFKAFEAVL